jgi:hypothetical protein
MWLAEGFIVRFRPHSHHELISDDANAHVAPEKKSETTKHLLF